MRAAVLSVATMAWLIVACGGADAPSGEGDATPADAAQAGADAPAPAATGEVIEIRMITDGDGNYFEPAEVEARRGDTLRFVLVSGVHNASFPEALNPGKTGLPDPGPMLQLPGQTYDLVVDFAPGEYAFQCDPHAALGMLGDLTVLGS